MNEATDPQPLVPVPPPSSQAIPAPMTFGQILDRTYRLMRKHYRLFFGIATVPAAVLLVFCAAMLIIMLPVLRATMTGNPSAMGAAPGGVPGLLPFLFLIVYPLIFLVYALYMPAACFAATQANRGITVTFRQAYSAAWSRFGRYLWLMILCALCVLMPIIVIAGLIGVGTVLLSGVRHNPACAFFLLPLVALFYIAILVYSVLIAIRLSVAYPVSIEENLSAWASIRRSLSLTRNAMGRIFLVILVVYAIVYAAELACILVCFAVAAVVGFIAVSVHVAAGSPAFFILVGLGIVAYVLIILATVLFSYAALTTAVAVLYHDQRLRNSTPAPSLPCLPPLLQRIARF